MQSQRPRRAGDARRRSPVIFFTLFAAYAWFHQGGGWAQNVRFDQVRAVVEEGTWQINGYCAYEKVDAAGRGDVRRRPLPDRVAADFDLRRLNSWDVSLHGGRIYPNKPPGATLLALPAYAAVWRLERLLGIDPDGWLGLTAGLYLTTVFSVGLLGALGGVIFFHLSRRLFPGVADRFHAAAALAFGLGTIYFPFSTMLFDHTAATVALLAGFALLLAACDEERRRPADLRLAAAGLFAGFAVVAHYTAVLAVGLFAAYLAWRLRPRWRLLLFVAGGVPPAFFLAVYHRLAFGDALTTANFHQLPRFLSGDDRLFGLFGVPDPRALVQLLFSDYRGLFVFSPVLALACWGLWKMLRDRRRAPEAVLFLAIFAAFLGLNASFNGWHAGSTFGPRYLIPGMAFLALPLAPAFERLPKTAGAVAVLSAAVVLLGTATAPLIHQSVDHPLLDPALYGFLGRLPLDPVARNAGGVYELGQHTFFGPGSFAARWNAFNLGEALFPQSRLSLVPLLLILALGTALAVRRR